MAFLGENTPTIRSKLFVIELEKLKFPYLLTEHKFSGSLVLNRFLPG